MTPAHKIAKLEREKDLLTEAVNELLSSMIHVPWNRTPGSIADAQRTLEEIYPDG